MRTIQHVIDTKALKNTLNSIPDSWVIRDLSERDYGIDLMVEIFSEFGKDKYGHPKYEATGKVCYLQVKGTQDELSTNVDGSTSFPVTKKALKYVEKFATPFLLIRVFNDPAKPIVCFLWLQRYIIDVIEQTNPEWRTEKQEDYSVRIPSQNRLPNNFKKIEKIAARIKYIEEFSEFYEKYMIIKDVYEAMLSRKFSTEEMNSIILDLQRILQLSTLLEYNHCQVDRGGIQNLIAYLQLVKKNEETPETLDDFPDPIVHNLNLLVGDNFMRMVSEELIADSEGDTVY